MNQIFQIIRTKLHSCKTLRHKDPAQNITWVSAKGLGGPNSRIVIIIHPQNKRVNISCSVSDLIRLMDFTRADNNSVLSKIREYYAIYGLNADACPDLLKHSFFVRERVKIQICILVANTIAINTQKMELKRRV